MNEEEKELVVLPENRELVIAANYLKNYVVNEVLNPEVRVDANSQRDHLLGVERNAKEIWERETGVEIKDGSREEALILLFTYSHDLGKWMKDKVQDINPEGLGLSEEEIELLNTARNEHQTGYTFSEDAAHHIYSALVFKSFLNDASSPLSKISTKDANLINEAILWHQFTGYYHRRATENGWSNDLIQAISRQGRGYAIDQENKLFVEAMRDADILSLCEIGRITPKGRELGGYLKILKLNFEVFKLPLGRSIDLSFKTVQDVGYEITSSTAKKMYEERVQAITTFNEDILSQTSEQQTHVFKSRESNILNSVVDHHIGKVT